MLSQWLTRSYPELSRILEMLIRVKMSLKMDVINVINIQDSDLDQRLVTII
jgi:hypothetical protein